MNRRKAFVVAMLLVGAAGLGAKKALDYSRTPSSPKECDFAYPNPFDPSKLSELIIDAPESFVRFAQQGGVINDASCLNKTQIYGVVDVRSEDDVAQALEYAREFDLKVTSAGARHSMGGQSFAEDGLVLDMAGLNAITIDREQKTMRVQSGATWAQVQQALDAQGLAVKAMQSINIFSIGGTLSVNAHGIAHNPGSVAPTVRSLRVMLADGSIVTATPTENTELFSHVLGGYGLFGVILEAEFEVVDNEMYDWQTEYVDYTDFVAHYREQIEGNDNLGLAFARLSVSLTSFLTQTSVHTFAKSEFAEALPPLTVDDHTTLERLVINFSKTGGFGRWVRWMLEKHFVPSSGTCLTRNQAMSQKEVCLISRNQKMYDSMGYLKNTLPDTDILQEYFVPQDRMPEFVDGLREIVQRNDANLLNVTIRFTPKDTVTALPYAKEDMFAYVLYFNQGLNEADSEVVRQTTVDLIDLATSLGGTFYLPYQLYYSPEQLRAAYPEVDDVFATKRTYDPGTMFVNTFFTKYGK